jgi:hypothetical protein
MKSNFSIKYSYLGLKSFRMKRLLSILFVLLALIIAYLLFYPTGLKLNAWTPPKAPELKGEYEANDLLTNLEIIFPGECNQCEDIAIDSSGNMYGGEVNGNIKVFKKGKERGIILANTGGRPLGLHFDKSENLIIADADKGLLSLSKEGELRTLANKIDNYSFKFADDLEIDSNGIIYFSDASNRFGFKDNNNNIIEHQPSGSFYQFNPKNRKVTLLIDSMYFSNGVAIDHEEEFIFINETMAYQFRKYWLTGNKKGSWEIAKDNLPGFPDGISRGENGIFWLTFASPRIKSFDDLLPSPFLRNVVARLPSWLQPSPKHYGIILGLNDNAEVIYNFQDPTGKFGEITSVQQFGKKLYLGSLYENGIGVLDLDNIR